MISVSIIDDIYWPELGRVLTKAEKMEFDRIEEYVMDECARTGMRVEDMIIPTIVDGQVRWIRRSVDSYVIEEVKDNMHVLTTRFTAEDIMKSDPEVIMAEKLAVQMNKDPAKISNSDIKYFEKLKEKRIAKLTQEINPEPIDWARGRDDFDYFTQKFMRQKLYPHQLRIHDHVENPGRFDSKRANDKAFLVLAARGHGKTFGLANLRPPWTITYDRDIRIKLISKSKGHIQNIINAHRRYFAPDGPLGSVVCGRPFKDPNPHSPYPWANDKYQVLRDKIEMLDPTVVGFAVEQGYVGTRSDELILDDPIDKKTTRGKYRRSNFQDDYQNEILTLNESDGREIIIGTRKARNDFYKNRMKTGLYNVLVLPAVPGPCEEGVHYHTLIDPDTGIRTIEFVNEHAHEVLCADLWDIRKLVKQRYKIGKAAWLMQYNQDEKLGGGMFDVDSLRWEPRGKYELEYLQAEGSVVIGVDPAYTENEDADYSAIAVVAILPDGAHIIDGLTCKKTPLNLEFTVREFIDRWHPVDVIIETVGFHSNRITGTWSRKQKYGDISFLKIQVSSKRERIQEFSKLVDLGLIHVADMDFGNEFSKEYGDFTGERDREDDHCLDAVEIAVRGRLDHHVIEMDADDPSMDFADGVIG